MSKVSTRINKISYIAAYSLACYICSICCKADITQSIKKSMQSSERLLICSGKIWWALKRNLSPEKGSDFNVWTDKSFFLGRGWLLGCSQSTQPCSSSAVFLWCWFFHGCPQPHSRTHQHLVSIGLAGSCPWSHGGQEGASTSSCVESHRAPLFLPCWETA